MTRKSLPVPRPFPLALAILLANLAAAAAQVPCPQDNKLEQHVFCGEINRHDRAVGFHSRPDGKDPVTVENTNEKVTDGLPKGIYELRHFTIIQGEKRAVKTFSTMFPDYCSKDDVLAAISNAQGDASDDGQFFGSSGDSCKAFEPRRPFDITGFINNGEVTTAYPDYRAR